MSYFDILFETSEGIDGRQQPGAYGHGERYASIPVPPSAPRLVKGTG